MPSNINTWINGARFGKSVIVGLVMIGIWLGAVTTTLGDKADKSTVDVAIATQTEVLKNINATLTTMATSLKSLDDRQDKTDQELARLEGKAEAEEK